jgi:hypothetical protein
MKQFLRSGLSSLGWIGLVGVISVSWVLVSFNLLLPALPRVIGLFIALVLLGGFGWLTVRSAKKLINLKRETRSFKHGREITWLSVFVILLFGSVAFITDWWLGATLRTSLSLSFLPPGNLLAGGKMGATYVVFAALVAIWVILKRRSESSSRSWSLSRTTHAPRAPHPHQIEEPEASHENEDAFSELFGHNFQQQ